MQPFSLFAAFLDAGSLGVLIPLSAIVLGITSGIVANLTKHQRQMAEIMRGTGNRIHEDSRLVEEIRALRSEVSDLKDRVNAVAIASDRPASQVPPNLPDDVVNRLQS